LGWLIIRGDKDVETAECTRDFVNASAIQASVGIDPLGSRFVRRVKFRCRQ